VTPEVAELQPTRALTMDGLVNPAAKSSRDGNIRPVTITLRGLALVIRIGTSPLAPGNMGKTDGRGPGAETEMRAS